MESIDRLICDKRIKSITTSSNELATSSHFASHRRAMVQASLSTVFGRKGRHLSGTFCLTGDTMEGIIQCLVFLKAFSVSLCLRRHFRCWAFNVLLLIYSRSVCWAHRNLRRKAFYCRSVNQMKKARKSLWERLPKVMIKWNFIPDISETKNFMCSQICSYTTASNINLKTWGRRGGAEENQIMHRANVCSDVSTSFSIFIAYAAIKNKFSPLLTE